MDPERLTQRLVERGLTSAPVLAERYIEGIDLEAEAKSLQISVAQAQALYTAAYERLDTVDREALERARKEPRGKGNLPPEHPTIQPILDGIQIEERLLTKERLADWRIRDRPWAFLPRGPLKAVDHRPKLGPARNQGGRPTCTSFGSTVVAEALEFLRDRRPGPRDFAEEFLWWYSKNGALITAGGYDCRAALYHYERNGVPSEKRLPYSGTQLGSNHAHVPVADDAIDRAHDHRQPPLTTLDARDVAVVKAVLETGRCVSFGSDTYDWNTGTGVISFPDPIDSRGVGGGHCTTIIGYIDRDDLPAHYEGGYFIVRNSWGGAESTTHLMGPEYGGHLLMPYGWYSRYTGWPATLGSDADATGTGASRSWRAEYFANPSLSGTPQRVDAVADVDFDWGTNGPFTISIPFPFVGTVDVQTGPVDRFSARFTQVRRLRAGWYRFRISGDDGVRLWVDDRLVLNGWKDQPKTTYETEHYVSGGDHVLRVEYYEAAGQANLELDIQAVEFHWDLFNGTDLAGTPAASFDDSMTDLEWRHAPPIGTALNYGRFSARATGRKRFAPGTYTFHAQHTGGCRIYANNQLVLDDWAGTGADGTPIALNGAVDLRVEFAHRGTIPAADAKTYYRAAVAFDWSEASWRGRIHADPARQAIRDAGWPNPDSIHEAFRVQALTGNAIFAHDYAVPAPMGSTYVASDGASFRLYFPTNASFGEGLPGGGVMNADSSFFSAFLTRRLHIPASGRYQVSLETDEAFRVCIDGNKVLERRYGGGDPFATEIVLSEGVHDVSIEYADSGWGSTVDFQLQPANWSVTYFTGIGLETYHATKNVMGLERLVPDRPTTLDSNWSARARRTMWLPVGRYRIAVRADDGVRVKAGGDVVIDGWNYTTKMRTAFLEHGGGAVTFEVEYFQAYGGASIEFDLSPEGYLGEYYRGTQLEKPADPGRAGWARNPPIAYRFEPAIDFDWGNTGRLGRVGSDEFSARWWGSVELPVGRWRFRVRSDDGVRLFLDDRLLIDRWSDHSANTYDAIVDLAAGRREVRVEYYERGGQAMCKMEIERVY